MRVHIANCQAIALRVYARYGALCWLFAPTDPEAVRALSSWCDADKVKLLVKFGSREMRRELKLHSSPAVIEMLRTSPPTRNPEQVRSLCDSVAAAESDGLLNALAFAPMTREVEKRPRNTCMVSTTLVFLAFQART